MVGKSRIALRTEEIVQQDRNLIAKEAEDDLARRGLVGLSSESEDASIYFGQGKRIERAEKSIKRARQLTRSS